MQGGILMKKLTVTRIFDAPRAMVWKAWIIPAMVKTWWGPNDFTCPVSRIDFKAGGTYLHCMHGPDNKDYWSTGIYKEIVPLVKIVCTDSFADQNGHIVPGIQYGLQNFPLELYVVIVFEELGNGKTKMTLHHCGFPDEQQAALSQNGWNQSFDKMEQRLKEEVQ